MSDPNLIRDLATAGIDPELLQRVVLELARGQAAIAAAEKAEAEQKARAEAALAAKRAANAERQRRFRDKSNASNALRDVTGRDGALPPKMSPTPPITTPQGDTPSDPNGSSAPKGAGRQRGTRIPDDFERSPEARKAASDFGFVGDAADEVLAEFADYWRPLPGEKAKKLDWVGTLRNRLRDVARRRPVARAGPARSRSSNGYYDLLRDDEFGGSDDQHSGQHRSHLRIAAGGRH